MAIGLQVFIGEPFMNSLILRNARVFDGEMPTARKASRSWSATG